MKEEFPSFTLLPGLSRLVMKEEFLTGGFFPAISRLAMKEEFLKMAFFSTPTRTYTNPSLYYLSCCICLPRGKPPLQLAANAMPNSAARAPGWN